MIDELDRDEGVVLMGEKEEKRKLKMLRSLLVMLKLRGGKLRSKLKSIRLIWTISQKSLVVIAATAPVSAASTIILAAEPNIPATTITVAPVKVAAASTRRRKRVVIRDPEEESSAKTPAKTKSNDKGKGIMGIKREFSVPRTPQQNGIAERKNRTLIEAVKTMLADSLLPIPFWAEAVNTACYVHNRVLVTKPHNKTPMSSYMVATGSSNPQNKEGDVAFDEKEHDDEKPESAVNLSPNSSALSGEQDDMTKKKDKEKSHVDYFTGHRDLNADFEDYSKDSSNDVSAAGPIVPTDGQNYSNITNPISVAGPSNSNTSPTHGKFSFKVASQLSNNSDMIEIEDIAYSDHENVGAEADFNNLETSIIEELLQFKMQKVWILVDLPYGKREIGTKWVYRNKKDERVARIEAIRLFLAYASFMGFMVYQMDVKSAFLYGTIEEEVYVCQPLGFEDPDHPDKVYKVVKAFYGLHQAPRAWLQALVNKKKVVVTEAAIRDALHLDDAKGVDCLPNEEIFTELACMGYEKPTTKLTFYKRVDTSNDTDMEDVSNEGRMIGELDRDEVSAAVVAHAAVSEIVSAVAVVPTVTAAPVKVVVPSTRQRRGVVIWNPEEESSVKTPTETKSKDKGKGIMVEEPKPMKKKQQVKLDEAYARKLHEKLNQDIDWEVAIDHVIQKAKEDPFIQRYQVMKKRPQTESQAR
nr:retrovirus-related Pol polyprotein from transposon TNT 1-94 [Tanacetum cinerariifolium]